MCVIRHSIDFVRIRRDPLNISMKCLENILRYGINSGFDLEDVFVA